MITTIKYLTTTELEAGLAEILRSPQDQGIVELIARRPRTEEREVLTEAQLHSELGLIGDNWIDRGSSRTSDGSAHPEMQLNIMNSRVIALLAQERERWALAGDQLFVDLDLSARNLPAGTQLSIGTAIIEVTSQPHTGCKKFVSRFGVEALKFVNSELGRELHLRGINARVIRGGVVRQGDLVKKIPA
jgi:hypothetical protein